MRLAGADSLGVATESASPPREPVLVLREFNSYCRPVKRRLCEFADSHQARICANPRASGHRRRTNA